MTTKQIIITKEDHGDKIQDLSLSDLVLYFERIRIDMAAEVGENEVREWDSFKDNTEVWDGFVTLYHQSNVAAKMLTKSNIFDIDVRNLIYIGYPYIIPVVKYADEKSLEKQDLWASTSLMIQFMQPTFAITHSGIKLVVPESRNIELVGLLLNPLITEGRLQDIISEPRSINNVVTMGIKLTVYKNFADKVPVNVRIQTSPDLQLADLIKRRLIPLLSPQQFIVGVDNETIGLSRVQFLTMDELAKNLMGVYDYYLAPYRGYRELRSNVLWYEYAMAMKTMMVGALADTYPSKDSGDPRTTRHINDGNPGRLLIILPKSDFTTNIKSLTTSIPSYKQPDSWSIYAINAGLVNQTFTFYQGLLSLIYQHRVDYGWYISQVYGVESRQVNRFLENHNNKIKSEQLYEKTKLNMQSIQDNLAIYYHIIEGKLGTPILQKLFDQARLKYVNILDIDAFLDLLGKNDKAMILREIDKFRNFMEEVVKNKCPHREILARLMGSTRKSEPLKELRGFFLKVGKKLAAEPIKCNNCGFEIICPHSLALIEYNIRGKSDFREYRDLMANYMTKVTGQIHNPNYYCKICGEEITSVNIYINDADELYEEVDDELKMYLWSEAVQIIRQFIISNITDMGTFIHSIVNLSYPYVYDSVQKIQKSKGYSNDEFKARKKLAAHLIVFAVMIKMITGHPIGDNIVFRGVVVRPGMKYQDKMAIYVKQSLKLITTTLATQLAVINGITVEFLKTKLLDNYKNVTVNQYKTTDGERTKYDDMFLYYSSHDIYRYAVKIWIMDYMVRGIKLPEHLTDLFKTILPNVSLKSLGVRLKSAAVKSKHKTTSSVISYAGMINIPDLSRWGGENQFDQLGQALSQSLAQLRSATNKFHLALVKQSVNNFFQSLKPVIERKYLYSVYKDKKSGIYTYTLRDPYNEIYDRCESHRKVEMIYQRIKKWEYIHSYNNIYHDNLRHWKAKDQQYYGRIYDNDGRYHQWTIMVLKNGKEVTNKDITSSLDQGIVIPIDIIDTKCGICGIKKSETFTLDNDLIKKKIEHNNDLANFIQFYEKRCPIGGVHIYKGLDICDKCYFAVGMVDIDKDRDRIEAYYNSHREVYQRALDDALVVSGVVVNVKYQTKKVGVIDFGSWSFQFGLVDQLSHKVEIRPEIIMALGSMESTDYAEITSGKFIPPEITSKDHQRIDILNSYISELFKYYNMIRHYNKISYPVYFLSKFTEINRLAKNQLYAITSKWPDLYDDYWIKFPIFRQTRKAREIPLFCLESLAKYYLRIIEIDGKLGLSFCKQHIKSLVRSGEMVTKPGYFNIMVLNKGEKADPDAGYVEENGADGNVAGDDDGDDGEDEVVMDVINAFDVDRDKELDNMDEDIHNVIKVDD